MTEDTIAERVRSVAEAFTVTGLARLTLKDVGFELELRRSVPYQPPVAVAGEPAAPAASAPAGAAELVAHKPDLVTSDLVGVVRFSRPQVSAGHQLESDRELAFVEALGIRNPVRSRGPGRIADVFVTDGQPVEYGQPLFAIER